MHPLHPYLARRLAAEHTRDLLRQAGQFRLIRAATPPRQSRRSRLRRLLPIRGTPGRTIDLAAPTAELYPATPCPIPAGPAHGRP